jgi:hypothetical protein
MGDRSGQVRNTSVIPGNLGGIEKTGAVVHGQGVDLILPDAIDDPIASYQNLSQLGETGASGTVTLTRAMSRERAQIVSWHTLRRIVRVTG